MVFFIIICIDAKNKPNKKTTTSEMRNDAALHSTSLLYFIWQENFNDYAAQLLDA